MNTPLVPRRDFLKASALVALGSPLLLVEVHESKEPDVDRLCLMETHLLRMRSITSECTSPYDPVFWMGEEGKILSVTPFEIGTLTYYDSPIKNIVAAELVFQFKIKVGDYFVLPLPNILEGRADSWERREIFKAISIKERTNWLDPNPKVDPLVIHNFSTDWKSRAYYYNQPFFSRAIFAERSEVVLPEKFDLQLS